MTTGLTWVAPRQNQPQVTPVTSLTYELWNTDSGGSTIAEAGKNNGQRLVFKWREGRGRMERPEM
jgi:hypothetical protein